MRRRARATARAAAAWGGGARGTRDGGAMGQSPNDDAKRETDESANVCDARSPRLKKTPSSGFRVRRTRTRSFRTAGSISRGCLN